MILTARPMVHPEIQVNTNFLQNCTVTNHYHQLGMVSLQINHALQLQQVTTCTRITENESNFHIQQGKKMQGHKN